MTLNTTSLLYLVITFFFQFASLFPLYINVNLNRHLEPTNDAIEILLYFIYIIVMETKDKIIHYIFFKMIPAKIKYETRTMLSVLCCFHKTC